MSWKLFKKHTWFNKRYGFHINEMQTPNFGVDWDIGLIYIGLPKHRTLMVRLWRRPRILHIQPHEDILSAIR